MKAAVIKGAGQAPVYAEFDEPVAGPGQELISVTASAMSNLTKARASGSHYSAANAFPAVAGTDGVGRTADGRRVYFVLPEAPFGAMAEKSIVDADHCIDLPDDLDDVTAAAIANPGMSSWAALAERAKLQKGETVLINGATGTAGRLAVQIAKYMGAGKVIATGRNVAELDEVKLLGADVAIAFALEDAGDKGEKAFEDALKPHFAQGVDVVVDYLWGASAKAMMAAIAKAGKEGQPVRFVNVGSAGHEESIELPAAALRSSSIVLMGSGLKSVPLERLESAIRSVFEAVGPAKLEVAVRTVPLTEVEQTWASAGGKPRVVFTLP